MPALSDDARDQVAPDQSFAQLSVPAPLPPLLAGKAPEAEDPGSPVPEVSIVGMLLAGGLAFAFLSMRSRRDD